MLDQKTLDMFTKEANKWRNQFCVRMYANNYFVKYKESFDSKAKDWRYTGEKAIENSCKYKNFRNITIPSLQHWWILSIARLTDPPFFKKNKDKQNLSIHYIIEILQDVEIESDIKRILEEHKEFLKSIRKLRNILLAHNWMEKEEKYNKIPAGIETFFENLNTIICKIKEKYSHLKNANDINLEYTTKLSEAWVKELFEKII